MFLRASYLAKEASICVSTLNPVLKDSPCTTATMGHASDNINYCWCSARPVSSAFKMDLLVLGSLSPKPQQFTLVHLEMEMVAVLLVWEMVSHSSTTTVFWKQRQWAVSSWLWLFEVFCVPPDGCTTRGGHQWGLGPLTVLWLSWCNQVPHTYWMWQFCSWVSPVKYLV